MTLAGEFLPIGRLGRAGFRLRDAAMLPVALFAVPALAAMLRALGDKRGVLVEHTDDF